MIKQFLLISGFLLICLYGQPVQASESLQALIDATEAGGILQLDNKQYEGPASVTKPMTIVGAEKTVIRSQTTGITVDGVSNVHIQSLQFQTVLEPIVMKNSQHSSLTEINVAQQEKGIVLSKVQQIDITSLNIEGRQEGHFSKQGHGLSLFEAQHVTLKGSRAQGVQDGFYFERTEHVVVQNNKAYSGRYGIHFMYGKDIELMGNTVSQNVTGAMLMIVEDASFTGNVIQQQNQLNSNGVFLYDVKRATVKDNVFSENTVATVWKNVEDTNVADNMFQVNGTAIEATLSKAVTVQNNTFHGNILTARSDKKGFTLAGNEYDDYRGNDYDGNGYGDTPYYAITSFGQWMVRKPVYQYYIESPGVVLLNRMDQEVKTKDEQLLMDQQPIVFEAKLEQARGIHAGQVVIGFAGLVLVLVLRRKLA